MSHSTTISKRVPVLGHLTRWWEAWRHTRWAANARNCRGPVAVECVARDIGVGAPEHVQAGKWPDSAGRLNLCTDRFHN